MLANLGRIYADWGKGDEAIAYYSETTRLYPNDAMAWYHLGLMLRVFGQDEKALSAFARAAELAPGSVEPMFEIGCLFRKQGRLDEAETSLKAVIGLSPKYATAFHSLGNVMRDRGDGIGAIANYRSAVALDPRNPIFHLDLARELSSSLMFQDAVQAFESLLALTPASVDALVGYALACADIGAFDHAVQACTQANVASPRNPIIYDARGEIDIARHDYPGALKNFGFAVELGSSRAVSWVGLGQAYNILGRFEEAAAAFRKALELEPENTMALKGITVVPKSLSDKDSAKLKKIVDDPKLPLQDRISAAFALGKLLDEVDQFDEAFKAYKWANATVRTLRAKEGHQFFSKTVSDYVSQCVTSFTTKFFEARASWGADSDLPVFVVGMPRSGTTLVEQICSSHSQVFGAGELPDINRFEIELGSFSTGISPTQWDHGKLAELADLYLQTLRAKSNTSRRVIDKTPGNVMHLGLITTLFPRAKVIFCDRDPLDTCLSCYFQWFARNNLMFTYDLADCAAQYNEQQRLISHWRRVVPLQMLHVQYEQLVADPEVESRKIIEFLELPWEPQCLEFYKNERSVQTASVWQVRQPMYNRSVGRWRQYSRHIGPLLAALENNKES